MGVRALRSARDGSASLLSGFHDVAQGLQLLVGDVVDVHLQVELGHSEQGRGSVEVVRAHDVDIPVQRVDNAAKPFGLRDVAATQLRVRIVSA